MHCTSECYMDAMLYTEKVTQGKMSTEAQLFIAATLVVNALLLSADNISFHLFLS